MNCIARPLLLLASLAASLSLSAQTRQATAFSVTGPPSDPIYVDTPEGPLKIEFNRRERSQPFRPLYPEDMAFYHQKALEDGSFAREIVARASLPPGSSNALLLFIPKNKAENKFAIVPVPDNVENFPAGSMRVFNGTGEPVYASIGNERVKLEAGFSEPVSLLDFHNRTVTRKVERGSDDGSTQVRTVENESSNAPVRLAREVSGRFEHVYDSPIRVSPRGRYILLVFKDPRNPSGLRLFTRFIYEQLPNQSQSNGQ